MVISFNTILFHLSERTSSHSTHYTTTATLAFKVKYRDTFLLLFYSFTLLYLYIFFKSNLNTARTSHFLFQQMQVLLLNLLNSLCEQICNIFFIKATFYAFIFKQKVSNFMIFVIRTISSDLKFYTSFILFQSVYSSFF